MQLFYILTELVQNHVGCTMKFFQSKLTQKSNHNLNGRPVNNFTIKPSHKLTLLTGIMILGTFACSETELLNPDDPELINQITSQVDSPRSDKFDSTWTEIDLSAMSQIAEVSSVVEPSSADGLSSTEAPSSEQQTSSDSEISSVMIGISSSTPASSIAVSSVAVSSVVVPSSSSVVVVSSVPSGPDGSCADPYPFSSGTTYQKSDVVEYNGGKYNCNAFCTVPSGHNPNTYGFVPASC